MIEQLTINCPWQEFRWKPVDLVSDLIVETGAEWKLLREENDWVHFLVGSKDIELFSSKTDG